MDPSHRPTLVFLHGVNNAENTGSWRASLDSRLNSLGYPELAEAGIAVYAPHYSSHLADEPSSSTAPERANTRPSDDDHLAFEVAQSRLRRLVGSEDKVETDRALELPGALMNAATAAPKSRLPLREADRYRTSEHVRNVVLAEILKGLPAGDLVVVAHSLGSVIAMDLVGLLPPDRRITRLVTLGSPLGIPAMTSYLPKLRRPRFPAHVVRSWLNALNPTDVVTGGRGLGATYPQAHNIVLAGGSRHAAAHYLDDSRVALSIGEALFGSTSRELAIPNVGVSERMSDAEAIAAFGLAMSRQVVRCLRENKRLDDTARRFDSALQTKVQAILLDLETARQPQAVSAAFIANLQGGGDLDNRWTREEVVQLLCSLVGHNFVAPYEIDTSPVQKVAFERMAASLGHGPELGRRCVDAHDLVLKELGLKKSLGWRMGLAAVGVVLVVAATGGLALAAAPGVAGAAAITSALATFGPGGMVGGLATAGTLLSTGTAAAAAALLNDESPAVLEGALTNALTLSYARKSLGYPDDLVAWHLVSSLHSGAAESLQSMQALSDKGSDSVKAHKARLDLIELAVEFLIAHELAPEQLTAGR